MSKHSYSMSPTLLYFWWLRNQPTRSMTTKLQSCVFVARFLLSLSPLEKENRRKTAVIAARPVTAQHSRGVGSPGALLAAAWTVAALLALNWSSSGTSLAREDYLLAACLQSAEKLVTMTTYCCVLRFFFFFGCCEVQEHPRLLEIRREECGNGAKIRPCWGEIVTSKTGDEKKEINMRVQRTNNDARPISSVLVYICRSTSDGEVKKRSHNETSASAAVRTQALLTPYIFLCTCCPLVLIRCLI